MLHNKSIRGIVTNAEDITEQREAQLSEEKAQVYYKSLFHLDALAPYQTTIPASSKIFILTSSLEYADELKSKEYPLVTGFIQKPIQPEDIEIILTALDKE